MVIKYLTNELRALEYEVEQGKPLQKNVKHKNELKPMSKTRSQISCRKVNLKCIEEDLDKTHESINYIEQFISRTFHDVKPRVIFNDSKS